MANKVNIVIQQSGEVISPTDLQSDTIIFEKEKRQKLIHILRQIPVYVDLAQKLIEGKTYQAIFHPEVLKALNNGSLRWDMKESGLYGAVIRDVETGHIAHHINLKEIPPDLLTTLNQLAIQQTLADIVRRLEIINEKITDILEGQVNDRLAEVESGIAIYEQAIVASNLDTRRGLLVNAIQELNGGRKKLIKSTDFRFIDSLPRKKLGMRFFTLTHGDIYEYVHSKAEPVWKAALAIVEASRYLVLAYSALSEPNSLRVSLEQVESEVKIFQNKMGEIVNWLPPDSNWRESLTTISQGVLPNIRDLDDIPQKIIIVEFQPKEIPPPKGV